MPVRVAKGNLALISATPAGSARSMAGVFRATLGRAFHLFPAVTIWLVMLIPHSAIGFTSSHQKTDTVHMKNGDKITCEIQSLQKGQLSVKSAFFHQLSESKWYAGAIANFLSNSEQQIALQSTLGGTQARRLIFTNRTDLSAIGGLGYIQEQDNSNH
jgi:hypothetical protein